LRLSMESFYVMDGEIEVKSELSTYTAKLGSFVSIPLGEIVQCFRNKSDKVSHLLCIVVPAGLDEFFLEIGKPVASDIFLSPPEMDHETMQKLEGIAKKYGQEIYPPDYLG
jgi:uncharacterized cupin superfamily protein